MASTPQGRERGCRKGGGQGAAAVLGGAPRRSPQPHPARLPLVVQGARCGSARLASAPRWRVSVTLVLARAGPSELGRARRARRSEDEAGGRGEAQTEQAGTCEGLLGGLVEASEALPGHQSAARARKLTEGLASRCEKPRGAHGRLGSGVPSEAPPRRRWPSVLSLRLRTRPGVGGVGSRPIPLPPLSVTDVRSSSWVSGLLRRPAVRSWALPNCGFARRLPLRVRCVGAADQKQVHSSHERHRGPRQDLALDSGRVSGRS